MGQTIKTSRHVCRECGIDISDKRKGAFFCSPEHRKVWNNRRMIRGAELYDLFMERRYNRDTPEAQAALTVMSNLGRAYRDADKLARDGRQSWNARETIERLPMTFGSEGDKR